MPRTDAAVVLAAIVVVRTGNAKGGFRGRLSTQQERPRRRALQAVAVQILIDASVLRIFVLALSVSDRWHVPGVSVLVAHCVLGQDAQSRWKNEGAALSGCLRCTGSVVLKPWDGCMARWPGDLVHAGKGRVRWRVPASRCASRAGVLVSRFRMELGHARSQLLGCCWVSNRRKCVRKEEDTDVSLCTSLE